MALFSSAYFSKCFKFYHPQNYLLEKKRISNNSNYFLTLLSCQIYLLEFFYDRSQTQNGMQIKISK